ncbi:MAG TPA: BadF/BadG/BcrA/BcrD ATPase family protein [Terracidiphilus sp.]|jgi:N-acetylglucosamine kinase-like BadF-type ATPase|nr:BadF/BadG/BcrA/BcrD ATPase family protein [Terracidiphilus sp.]
MSAVLGIDGGGTRTRASIVDGETVLAFVEHASIKRLRVGAEAADANLRSMLKDVIERAGMVKVEAASVGVASATMPGVADWIGNVLREFGISKLEVVGDHIIALDAAFKGGPGILQIAGTGTNCVGRAPDGGSEAAGGWSSRLGDEGSGYWIGLHAVRRALVAYDREEPTGILEAVGRAWGTKTIDELVNVGDGTPSPDFAVLAPTISKLAEEGDSVAAGVLAQAAKDLVDSVLLVRAKLWRKHHLTAEVPVAWIGSVIGKSRQVREAFFAGLRAAAQEMPIVETEVAGIEGAVWRAKRLAAQKN